MPALSFEDSANADLPGTMRKLDIFAAVYWEPLLAFSQERHATFSTKGVVVVEWPAVSGTADRLAAYLAALARGANAIAPTGQPSLFYVSGVGRGHNGVVWDERFAAAVSAHDPAHELVLMAQPDHLIRALRRRSDRLKERSAPPDTSSPMWTPGGFNGVWRHYVARPDAVALFSA